jgi:hypothetical protein
MKQRWAPDELINYCTLSREETDLVNKTSKTDYNRIGCAVLLKHFQIEGKFPHRKQDIPDAVVEHIAQQLKAQSSEFKRYELRGVAKRHRVQIRTFLGVHVGTVADAKTILAWLFTHDQLLEEHNLDRLKGIVYERYKELKIEPPEPKRIERLIHSAVRTADERLHKKIVERLTPETQEKLDALLNENSQSGNTSPLSNLKTNEVGTASLENVLSEIIKLEHIRALSLPPDLFSDISRKRILWCKQRIAVEDLSEIRRHPTSVRYTLLSAFCYQRERVSPRFVRKVLIRQ